MSKRTQEILANMTLEQKIYHLEQLPTATFLTVGGRYHIITGPESKLKLKKDMVYDVGTTLNLVGAETMIDATNDFLKGSKYKIPLMIMQDVIHGHRTLYPINLGVAASFDRELAKVELDSITFSDNFKRRMNTLLRNLGYNHVPHPEVETEEMKE